MTASIDDPHLIRRADPAQLAGALAESRAATLQLFATVRGALGSRLDIPYAVEVNPPLWELGHVAWFEEFWLARNTDRLRGTAARLAAPRAASLLPHADALYDSSKVPHTARWHLDLPDADRTQAYAAQVRERTLALLRTCDDRDDALYFFSLALFHEDMHREADTMNAQGLALDASAALEACAPAAAVSPRSDLAVAGAVVSVGVHDGGFAFDNELGEHCVAIDDFRIDATPVTWGDLLPFIEADGYDDAQWWTRAGRAWRLRALPQGLPRYLRRTDEGNLERATFGRWTPIDPAQPAVNLSQHEALAWCAWAGRRLPTEHEWAHALSQAGDAFAWGEVWEWTASAFEPWPGFAPHPYRDYSQPWFDGRPVLKGGSFATAARMKHPRYRNFFGADRNDVFAGFRSCAVQAG